MEDKCKECKEFFELRFDDTHYKCLYESTQKRLEEANRKIAMLEKDIQNYQSLVRKQEKTIKNLMEGGKEEQDRWEWRGQ